MKIFHKSIFVFSFFLLFFSHLSLAKVQYVSDELAINMRSGKGNGFKITNIIKSGTALTILKKSSGYTMVKTPNGHQGWVLSRFLINTPVARTLLSKAQSDVLKMKKKYDAMVTELNDIKTERDILSHSEKKLLENKENLNIELSSLKKIAARPMQLEEENEQLRNELVKIESENSLIKQEHQALADNSDQKWFMTGAGVLFGGMLLGLILPKLRSGQRKANWNRL